MICCDHQLLPGKCGRYGRREMHGSLHSATCLEEIAVDGRRMIHIVSCAFNVVHLISNTFSEFSK